MDYLSINQIIDKAFKTSGVPFYYKKDAKQEAWLKILKSSHNNNKGLLFKLAKFSMIDFMRKINRQIPMNEDYFTREMNYTPLDTYLDINILSRILFKDTDKIAIAMDLCNGKTIREISNRYRVSNRIIYEIKGKIRRLLEDEDTFRTKKIK
jgi:DNA-directed RNA polymerase specialized sigma24 family protein